METFANMKCNFLKISWGVVEINDVKVYCELWLSTNMMNLKVKFKIPKGMSYSYTCSTNDGPFEDGQFLSYWIPKNIYFPVHFCGTTVNELVELVIKHLNLKFFEESRKWLTKDEKTTAELLAMKCISKDDLEWMLNCDTCDIPQVFWKYAKAYSKEYDNYLARVEKEEGRYQVNISESVDGDVTPWISEWSNDGYVGTLVDTQYMDGCDTTNWCVFVGTHSECEAYIRKY